MKTIKSESYRLETPEGSWLGQVVITSDGFLGAVTDYGNFSFAWRAIGSQSFKEFIMSLGEDYFASKLYQGLSCTDNGPRVRKACERFAEEILPVLKKKLQETVEKNFFVREERNTTFKNTLDVELRAAFSKYKNKIITQEELNQFADLHKKTSDNYFQIVNFKCKPIEYKTSFDGQFTPTSSRDNHTIFVTDGYWLEVIEVKE